MSSKITTVAFVLLSCLNVLGQKTEFVKSDSLLYPIHKANLGKIAFIGTAIALENLKKIDFLKSITFTEKTDLNIRVFLEQSLTNHLHLLAPQASSDALTSHGNYQFTFIVDSKKVYTVPQAKIRKQPSACPYSVLPTKILGVGFFGTGFIATADKMPLRKAHTCFKLKSDLT